MPPTLRMILKYYRSSRYYLAEEIVPEVVDRVEYVDGKEVKKKSVVVNVTIWTRVRWYAVERAYRFIIPDATIDDYMDKPCYRVSFRYESRAFYIRVIGRRRWLR